MTNTQPWRRLVVIGCAAGGLMLGCAAHAHAEETLSLAGARTTLDQNFARAPQWRSGATDVSAPVQPLSDPSFSWAAGYIWNHGMVGSTEHWPAKGKKFPAWTSNTQADADPNGDMIATMDAKDAPLQWSGTLNFIAGKMPERLAATVGPEDPKEYMGASIISYPYAQRYGVFAMVAKLPKGNGTWPAFWLLPASKAWPPEIDVMEVIGREPSTLYTTLHMTGANGHEAKGHGTPTNLDLSAEFHEYAVDWGPTTIRWYFDRKLVFTQPTPESFKQPFYLIANLAIGKDGAWGGAPDASTPLPAVMQVKSIRAWQRPEYEAGN